MGQRPCCRIGGVGRSFKIDPSSKHHKTGTCYRPVSLINERPTDASNGRGLAQIKMILKVRRLSLVINYQRYYAGQLMAARIAQYFYFLEFYYVDPLSS